MPHACSPCFCPYTTENASIFGKNRSPRSICQSRTHTTTPWTGSKRNREIIAFFQKSRSLIISGSYSLGDRPQINRNHVQAWQSRTFPPKPANRNREIVDFHQNYQDSPNFDVVWERLSQINRKSPKIRTRTSMGRNSNPLRVVANNREMITPHTRHAPL